MAALTKHEIDDVRAKLASTRKPVMRVTLLPDDDADVTVSKVGGRAYLPPGGTMPAHPDGHALELLAQVRFDEMPPMPGFPPSGLLQFFIDGEDDLGGLRFPPDDVLAQTGFRVVFHPTVEGNRAGPPPSEDSTGPVTPGQVMRMAFSPGDETITSGDATFQTIVGLDAHDLVERWSQAEGIDEEALAEREVPQGFGHKVGGYPYFTQSDPRDPDTDEILLFQLDTDEADGVQRVMWGDVGVGNFFITPDALAARDFSRVRYNWDCC